MPHMCILTKLAVILHLWTNAARSLNTGKFVLVNRKNKFSARVCEQFKETLSSPSKDPNKIQMNNTPWCCPTWIVLPNIWNLQAAYHSV